jgi:uncharacterized protein
MSDSPSQTAASFVIEHIVPKGRGLAFRWWHAHLTRSARQYEGYIRTDLCPPVQQGLQLRWYSIIHFESPDQLNRWLKSADRERLIESGRNVFKTYQFKSFGLGTGLEGWFCRQKGTEQLGLGPPAWKQNLAVVFALYPVVMLQTWLFDRLDIMADWPLASSMLINNLITSSILTWAVMPLATRLLRFWLQPTHQEMPLKQQAWGLVVVMATLGAFVYGFGLA